MSTLKLTNIPISFSLDTPLEQNERFLKWKSNVSKDEVIKLFVTLMHDKRVIYQANVDGKINIPENVYSNLQYLARMCGYNVDLLVTAKCIAEKEKNYSAHYAEPQLLPKKDREYIEVHGNRSDFNKYDSNLAYSGR